MALRALSPAGGHPGPAMAQDGGTRRAHSGRIRCPIENPRATVFATAVAFGHLAEAQIAADSDAAPWGLTPPPSRCIRRRSPPDRGAYQPGTAVAGWLPAPLALSVVAPLSLLPRPWRALSGRIRGRARGPSPPGWAYRPHPYGMRRWPWGRSSLAAARWAAPPVLFAQPWLRPGRARRPLRPGSAAPRLLAPTPALGGRPSAPGRAPCSVALPSAPGVPASLGRPPVWARVGPCAAWRRGPSVPPLAGRLSPSPGGSRCPPAALIRASLPLRGRRRGLRAAPWASLPPPGERATLAPCRFCLAALVVPGSPLASPPPLPPPLGARGERRARMGGLRAPTAYGGGPPGAHVEPDTVRPVRLPLHFTRRSRPRQAI